MANKKKTLLILERSSSNLTVDKASGDYILEGIFAQFGVENNNKRIYEEKEYLPHLEYLKEKINENRLMGELDHPEKFEISLDKVSHLVESLEYDESSRQIKGRVRILDTPAGKIAKSLIDSGIPISISSRAAGSVSESKKVNIKRIFTYDLVADPGFNEAQLSRINESLGLEESSNLQVFDASSWEYNFNESNKENKEEIQVKENNNKEFVTVESMNNYSILISEEFKKISDKLDSISESNSTMSNSDLEDIKRYTNYLAEEVSKNRKYSQYLGENLDNSISYMNEELATNLDNSISYMNEELATKLDQSISYMNEELAPNLDQSISYGKYLAENLDMTIDYAQNELGKKLDESILHNDYLVEEITKNRAYSEYLAESAVSSKEFKSLVEYSEHMFENHLTDNKEASLNESKNLNESTRYIKREKTNKTVKSVEQRGLDINDKIDRVLETIKKEKIESVSENNKYPFLNLLSEGKRAEFASLDETKKEKVKNSILEAKTFDKAVIESTFDKALIEKPETINEDSLWLDNAPKKYKDIFEGLSIEKQDQIKSAAVWYRGKLKTDYQIANFWQTRGLDETISTQIEDNQLFESKKEEIKSMTTKSTLELGYTTDRVAAIGKTIKKRY